MTRSQEAEIERIAKRALGTRATLLRALRRSTAPVRPAQGVSHAAGDEVSTQNSHHPLPPLCQ